jgi:CheY-like chemotaxis protein
VTRILVVDDEDLPRRAVVRMLETAGHEVREADGGSVALELLSDSRVDLVVTDIAMPNMNGFEFIARLRSHGESVPVIAISGNVIVSDAEVARHAAMLAPMLLLAKPFSRDELLAAVASALPLPAS